MSYFDLKNKVAIVTGGSRGIGRAISIKLASEGCKVLVNYLKNKTKADEVVEKIRNSGGEAIAVQGDVGDWSDAGKIVENALEDFGTIDILVNNAGVFLKKEFYKMSPDEWDLMFKTNILGVVNMSRRVVPIMIEKRSGVIINIASILGLRVRIGSGRVIYGMTKWAVIGFTWHLAQELAPYNVRVNAVAPGLIDTDMARNTLGDLSRLAHRIPLRRIGRPEHIAEAVAFLARHDHITGEVLIVSGGE